MAVSQRLNTKSDYGQHIVHLTRQGQYKEIAECIMRAPILIREVLRTEQDPQQSPVFIAAQQHFLKCMTALVTIGKADVKLAAEHGITPLHVASKNDKGGEDDDGDYEQPSIEIITYLINQGADPFAKDIHGCIPIHYACRYGALNVIKLLLKHNDRKQLEALDHKGQTPFMHAVSFAKENVVQYLLEKDIDVTRLDVYECTAFHYACHSGSLNILRQLEDYANQRLLPLRGLMEGCNTDGEMPLHFATLKNDMLLIKKCLELTDYDRVFRTPAGDSQLHIIAKCKNFVEVDKAFVESLVNEPNEEEQTPLFMAIEHSDTESVQFLINCGAWASYVDNHQMSPVLLAAKRGRADVCEVLLQMENVIWATDDRGRDALMLAVENRNLDVVETILKAPLGKQLITHEDSDGNTALHVAVDSGSIKVVKALLQENPDVDVRNYQEHTPLHVAAMKGHREIASLLCRAKESLVNEADENGNYAIHLAAAYGHVQILKLFVYDPELKNAENLQGRTPLALAAEHKQPDCVVMLLKENATVDSEDKGKITPLMLACRAGNFEVACMLIEHGANPAKCAEVHHPLFPGWNSLDFAVDAKSLECVKLILGTKKWRTALRNVTVNTRLKVDTPFRRMVRRLPSAAKLVMDRCVVEIKAGDTHEINFNYEFLDERELKFPRDSPYQWKPDGIHSAEALTTKFKTTVQQLPGMKNIDSSSLNVDYEDGLDNPDWLESQSLDFKNKMRIPKRPLWERMGDQLRAAYRFVSNVCCCQVRDFDIDKEADVQGLSARDDDDSNSTITVKRPPHILKYMVKYDREELLNHKLTCSLLTYKSVRANIISDINTTVYAIFLTLFTSFMLATRPPFEVFSGNITNVTSSCEQLQSAGSLVHDWRVDIAKYGVLVLASVRLIMEFSELIIRRMDYFAFVNVLEVSMYTLALLTVVDKNPCLRRTNVRENWQWQTGSAGLLLAWIDLLLFIRGMVTLGIYVTMFVTVLKTFLKFFIVFCPFILGFMFGFHALLSNQIGFMNIKNSIMKMLGITTGELDTSDTLFKGLSTNEYGEVVFYKDATFTVFGFSIALITIGMMNLLVGLAVDDIKEVQRCATLENLRMKIQLAFESETSTKFCSSCLESPKYYTYNPKKFEGYLDFAFGTSYVAARESTLSVESGEKEDETTTASKESLQSKVQKLRVQTLQIAGLLDKVVSRYVP